MILIQAIGNAMVHDLVLRNVADLANVPTGKPGRPSRSLDLEQARAVLDAAKGERLWPYVAVSTLGGAMYATGVRVSDRREGLMNSGNSEG
jgi:hypothetical protein